MDAILCLFYNDYQLSVLNCIYDFMHYNDNGK